MKLFSSQKDISLKQYESILTNINFLSDRVQQLSSTQIKERVQTLKKSYNQQKNDEELIVDMFALTREIAARTLGLRHFDTQILGGLVLNDGKIAEMKTGEGKTLVATLAASYNALSGKGVHLVTVNDYLAKRDKEWMQSVYQSLGLSVGFIQKDMNQKQRQINYAADITYVTNSELGFDFLRDGTSESIDEIVLRPFNFCIIDEVDSILIDEARTPLILSSSVNDSNKKYGVAKHLIQYLKLNNHFEIDQKSKNVILTDKGIELSRNLLGVSDLYDINDPWFLYLTNALKAEIFFLKDRDYIVIDNKVAIIDEFSGRIMPDRRWSQGLHQAIETKENLPVGNDLKTIASITYQSFFSLYPKISGMTGTAKTSEEEFKSIYNLKIEVVPTKNSIQRKDLPDLVYLNKTSKWEAVINECAKMYKLGRPTLVGTTNLEDSELVSEWLSALNIKHQLLNAKPENIKRESDIIAQAGRKHAITIATNMAGRGTDILLGGNPKNIAKYKLVFIVKLLKTTNTLNSSLIFGNKELFKLLRQLKPLVISSKRKDINKFLEKLSSSEAIVAKSQLEYLLKKAYRLLLNYYQAFFIKENQEVKELGGLYVIGTERNESIRIDNQLRGRSGRQGDPGISRFFISLEDTIFRNFGGDKIIEFLKRFQFDMQTPIDESSVINSLDKIQDKIETHYYNIRRELRKYDQVLDFYRNFVINERRQILESKQIRDRILLFYYILAYKDTNTFFSSNQDLRKKIWKFSNYQTQEFFPLELYPDSLSPLNFHNKKAFLLEQFILLYDLKCLEIEKLFPSLSKKIQKKLLLGIIDKHWNEFLEKTSALNDVIGWQNYAQKDPLIEYKRECYLLFENFLSNVRQSITYDIMEIEVF